VVGPVESDIGERPDSIVDLGNSVVVVTNRPAVIEGAGWRAIPSPPSGTETAGSPKHRRRLRPACGRWPLVFSRRFDDPPAAASRRPRPAADVTARDVAAGAVAWKLNLPPAHGLPVVVDGRVEAGRDDADGTVGALRPRAPSPAP
jgi:hypothetical protein